MGPGVLRGKRYHLTRGIHERRGDPLVPVECAEQVVGNSRIPWRKLPRAPKPIHCGADAAGLPRRLRRLDLLTHQGLHQRPIR